MLGIIRKLLGRTYHPLNAIEISTQSLFHNYSYLSSFDTRVRIAPVLKSNAYGHGIKLVAKALDDVGAPFFCVDSIYEGYELLKAGIKTPILIMGYISPQNLKVKKLPFSYAVYNKEQLEIINTYQKGAGIHIKFDSGMHRLGVTIDELPSFIETIKQYRNITVEGFMSHLAESESPDSGLIKFQVQNIEKALAILQNYQCKPHSIHISNSGGIIHNELLRLGDLSNMARSGLALYGIDPSGKKDTNLKPVLNLHSQIVQIKKLQKGNRVGYNGTYTAKNDMLMAVLPIGYYDGVDRRLSNKGSMLVDNVRCPIIGRVSMNITTIDISNVKDPFVGQDVIVYSNNPDDPNSIVNSAKLCETIPYDLLVHLAASTRREVV